MRWMIGYQSVGLVLLSATALAVCIIVYQLGTTTSRVCSALCKAVPTKADREAGLFPRDYRSARERFLGAARVTGGHIESFQNPNRGPEGAPLFMDVLSLGNEKAENALVVSSGTHGVEGFAGSGIQTKLLEGGIGRQLPSGVKLLMIHAINPYGMAHLRRFNEDNVDLNRNFRDHSLPHPQNASYAALARIVAPKSISFWAELMSWSKLLWFRATAGSSAVQEAVSGGQYSDPEGLFYGGTSDTWSNVTVRAIVDEYLTGANRVVVVDFHTGLGQYGDAEIILNVPADSPEYRRARAIWGQEMTKSTATGSSVSTHLDASLKRAYPALLPAADVTAVSLEFGTVPNRDVLIALRAENWLHHRGGPHNRRAEELKTCLLEAFHPGKHGWEAAVWEQGRDVIERALKSLAL